MAVFDFKKLVLIAEISLDHYKYYCKILDVTGSEKTRLPRTKTCIKLEIPNLIIYSVPSKEGMELYA